MSGVARLQDVIGAALLRTNLLGAPALRICGRYTVEAFLGRGATAVVVAAQDTRLDRPVALKLSIADPVDGDLTEARALAKLDHPNVVRVYDAEVVLVELQGRTWRLRVLVMQRVEAVSLRTWLQQAERSPAEILAAFRGAGRGLAAAHAQHVVHRDFKPDNVLVRSDGVPQVLDFGFAIAGLSTRSANRGRAAEVAGTDAYLAPEARRGLASALADQYSFAISLAESLTGELSRPSFWPAPGVPRYVWRALRRASRKRPQRRYPSMDELLRKLDHPRRWPMVALAVALLVAGALYYARSAGSWSWIPALATEPEVASLVPSLPQATLDASSPMPDGASPVAPSPVAPSPLPASPLPASPLPASPPPASPLGALETATPTPACLRLPRLGWHRVRTMSAVTHLNGCYIFSLVEDRDGCATVAEVVKDGSGSGAECWAGDRRQASGVESVRAGDQLTVRANLGGRAYTFDLRLGSEGLEGEFRSSLGRESDSGSISEGR